MKVLFVTNIPSPYRVDFFDELGKMCDLTVLFERQDALDRKPKWLSCRQTYFKAEYLRGKKVGTDSAICFSVTKWLHKEMFDIFIVGGYGTPTNIIAIETLRFRKIPFVLNVDGGLIRDENKLKFITKKHLINAASYYLSSGKNTSNFLKYYGAVSSQIHEYTFTSLHQSEILNNPLYDKEKIKYKEKLKISEHKMIISVAQFIHRKGLDVLLESCKELPKDYGIYIVGGEPTKEYISVKEKFKLDNVHFVGFKTKDKLKKYYLASDLFVLPTREDIWGLVINEAMACGLPVISTNRCIAGLELVKDYENGFIIPVEREDILTQRIDEVLSNEQLKDDMGKASLEKIKKYTIENMAQKHIEIFNLILKIR